MNPAPSINSAAWLWKEGTFTPCDSVPVTDRGFRYGMSAFESFPVRDGKAFFLAEHYARLSEACAGAELKCPLPSLVDLVSLFRGVSGDGFARIYATAGDGGVVDDGPEGGNVFVFIEPRPLREVSSEDSYELVFHREAHLPILGGLKTANYWQNLLALKNARKNLCDEAVLFNIHDEVISACMANLFVVQGGKIKTPATSSGSRAGVIRGWILGNRSVEECAISRGDVVRADEIFLTSSWLGVMPVSSIEGHSISGRDTVSQLLVEYRAKISELGAGG